MKIETWIALGSFAIALIVMLMNSRKDTRGSAEREARMEAKLDNISAGVTDLRVDVRTMQKTQTEQAQQIAQVKAKAENTERRVTDLEHMFHKAHPPA